MNRFLGLVKFISCVLAGAVTGCLVSFLAALSMVWFRSPLTVVALVSGWIVVAGVAGGVAGAVFHCRPMQRRQKVRFLVAMVLWLPFIGMVGDLLMYEPIKFSYLVHRVESASTPAEERRAFLLAKRWGQVWEVNLREPSQDWFDAKQLDAAVRDPNRTLALELEWLECKPNGAPYRAYRTLTDKSNIYVLRSK